HFAPGVEEGDAIRQELTLPQEHLDLLRLHTRLECQDRVREESRPVVGKSPCHDAFSATAIWKRKHGIRVLKTRVVVGPDVWMGEYIERAFCLILQAGVA